LVYIVHSKHNFILHTHSPTCLCSYI